MFLTGPRNTALAVSLLLSGFVAACDTPAPEPAVPAGEPLWAVPVDLREESLFVAGVSAGLNPRRPDPVPEGLEQTHVRIVAPADPQEPELIVVTVSGVYAGMNNFRVPAQHVVRATGGRVQFWMTDRRSNNLEDRTGMLYAQRTGDVDAAIDYYWGGRALDGRRFDGFWTGPTLPWASEWGLGTHFGDLAEVIREARRRHPQARVVWMGHSMGSMWGQLFSAWDLDCDPATPGLGRDLLDGLVLLDGAINPVLGFGTATLTEQDYLEGIPLNTGGAEFRFLGLDALRRGGELTTDLGSAELFAALEIAALGHVAAPGRDWATPLLDRVFTLDLLLTLLYGGPIRATGGAILGLALDDDYEPMSFARFRMGRLVGPVAARPNPLLGLEERTLFTPTRSDILYRWTDREEHPGRGPAVSLLDEVAESFFAGPGNFLEWYFPMRLLIDLSLGIGMGLDGPPADRWTWDYGLCFDDPSGLELPVLAVAAEWGVAPEASDYDAWIAATGVTGETRITLAHNHLDMLVAAETARNPLLDALTDWLTGILD